MLTDNFQWLSTPCTYVEFELSSLDGKEHKAGIYFDVGTDWCVDNEKQTVQWERQTSSAGLTLLKAGSTEQPILEKAGDNLRIDWGYLYVAVLQNRTQKLCLQTQNNIEQLSQKFTIPDEDDKSSSCVVGDNPIVLATLFSFAIPTQGAQSKYLVVGYDDIYSIEFMNEKLRPWYWKEYGDNFTSLLDKVYSEYSMLKQKCEDWDQFLLAELAQRVSTEYAALVGLTYRHVFCSGKIVVGKDNTPWFFHKECFSMDVLQP
jgi:hypothetical protein